MPACRPGTRRAAGQGLDRRGTTSWFPGSCSRIEFREPLRQGGAWHGLKLSAHNKRAYSTEVKRQNSKRAHPGTVVEAAECAVVAEGARVLGRSPVPDLQSARRSWGAPAQR